MDSDKAGQDSKDVTGHSDEADEAFVRSLKLVTEIKENIPPAVSPYKEWAEMVMVFCVLIFTFYCLGSIVLWFYR